MSVDVGAAIGRRAAARGLVLSADASGRLREYLDVLAFWNRRVNLTSFDLGCIDDGISDEAIDRLVLEAVEAAPMVLPTDTTGVDIGSGSGSPAVPLMICCPWLQLTLVEVRERKAAFLREVLRTLALPGRVENARAEELHLADAVPLVTMRAVRAEQGIVGAVDRFMEPGGRFFWFGAPVDAPSVRSPLIEVDRRGSVCVFRR